MGDDRLKTALYDKIVDEVNQEIMEIGLTRGCKNPKRLLANRNKVWRLTRKSQRWAMIADVVGYGHMIFFFSWVPYIWIYRTGDGKFQLLLDQMKANLNWLRNIISQYLDDDARKILFTIDRGIVSHIILILTS